VIRTLREEIARVVRARVVNPKWIRGVMRHGYKGAFEMAATVDYLFAFAATTDAVADHQFDLVYDAMLGDPEVRAFLEQANPARRARSRSGCRRRLDRGLWQPRANAVYHELDVLDEGARPMKTDGMTEDEINARHAEKMAKKEGGARPDAGRQDLEKCC